MEYTINCGGRLLSLATPRVMAIVNATPDSFYAASRTQAESDVRQRVRQALAEGADIIDVGGCSTRPGAQLATEQEETERLRKALKAVRSEAPKAVLSVDTFRPDVARMAVEEFGADIINDVGDGDDCKQFAAMARMVARLHVAYVYTSRQPDIASILKDCARAVSELRSHGQNDIMVDPGFGFGKTLADNYSVLREMQQMEMLQLPVLVGVSRKSMATRLLDIPTDEALNTTTALHTIALLKGASVLRVHDVRQAAECIKIVQALSTQPQ